jgi:hypothetical protein
MKTASALRFSAEAYWRRRGQTLQEILMRLVHLTAASMETGGVGARQEPSLRLIVQSERSIPRWQEANLAVKGRRKERRVVDTNPVTIKMMGMMGVEWS